MADPADDRDGESRGGGGDDDDGQRADDPDDGVGGTRLDGKGWEGSLHCSVVCMTQIPEYQKPVCFGVDSSRFDLFFVCVFFLFVPLFFRK